MTAVGTGVGSLLVSLSLANSEEVVENFTLTATNLNNTDISTITVPGIAGQNCTLSVGDTTSCDVYAFQVTAWNDVGSSPFSEIITRSFPSLPEIMLHGHSLSMIEEDVVLNVTFTIRVYMHFVIVLAGTGCVDAVQHNIVPNYAKLKCFYRHS